VGDVDGRGFGGVQGAQEAAHGDPIVALPRRQGTYTLDTDASAGQVGAVLLQEQPDQSTRPVGYWSRSLNAAERNYSTMERECLVVVWASLLLRPYV